ncbi:MAG: 3,4-dihydroxy-2-butanone-4-phosphate synthase [Candidatus Nitrosocaldus sp.]|nr:3,4-dihydroxy-2-butanone-4-phosphate synthase [Candidatus Nitrosocaldus sp.]MDW8000753.1 3,4-dihydroxy-2-butanone-4-phosphate synthase [Candidatus Nitrosocaldus sp.]
MVTGSSLYSVEEAIDALRQGRFVLLHDGKDREDEVDMLVAAQFVTPRHIATMRRDAGGLICLALGHDTASRLGLLYMHDLLMLALDGKLRDVVSAHSPYGDRPSFSITINHRDTYTGITDRDRALTISGMARVVERLSRGEDGVAEFIASFRSPGHVPLLIAAKNLMRERRGHTEMAIYLAEKAGLIPAVAICEMLDSSTHTALSFEKARRYAERHGLCILDASMLAAERVE